MEERLDRLAEGEGLASGGGGEVFIRGAGEGEAAVVAGVIRQSFEPVAEMFGLTAENCPKHPSNCRQEWVEKDLGRGVVYFVLMAGGEACGCVAMEKAEGEACYLERLAVLPGHQGKGYGKMLVEHVLDAARQTGKGRVGIAIIAKHQALRDWYEKLGFEARGTKAFPQLPFEVLFLEHRV
jgi:GNAT superfamily N-acetyltransferase